MAMVSLRGFSRSRDSKLSTFSGSRMQENARIYIYSKEPTLNDGNSGAKMSERVEGGLDGVLVVVRADDGQGLPAAVTQRYSSKQRTQEITGGSQLHPAPCSGQLPSWSSIDFNIVESLHDDGKYQIWNETELR